MVFINCCKANGCISYGSSNNWFWMDQYILEYYIFFLLYYKKIEDYCLKQSYWECLVLSFCHKYQFYQLLSLWWLQSFIVGISKIQIRIPELKNEMLLQQNRIYYVPHHPIPFYHRLWFVSNRLPCCAQVQ